MLFESIRFNSFSAIMVRTVKRERHIDIIKGWAMLTIIVFHCSQLCFSGTCAQLLGNHWDVAVFFIIAGCFLQEESLKKPGNFLKGKFLRLYLPATVIYSIAILLHNVFVWIGWYPLGEVHPFSRIPYHLFGFKETAIGLIKVLAAGGSGELVMGAMWFIYTLLYAFVGITLLYLLVCRIFKRNESRFSWMTVVLLFFASISCVLSARYDITISRFSTAVTAMFLIWWGMILNRKLKWQYDKWWGCIIAIVVFVHCVLMQRSGMVLAKNEYQDIVQLTVGSSAAIYIWGFIGKKIENSFLGAFLALMGRESLYLMAFHIVGFFICNSLLKKLGVFSPLDSKGTYTYFIGNNYLLLVMYVGFAITTSFVLLYAWRGILGLRAKS